MSNKNPYEFTVRHRPPAVRCFRCGSTEITALCPLCYRTMCGRHRPRPGTYSRLRRQLPLAWRRRLPPAAAVGHCAVCEPGLSKADSVQVAGGAGLLALGLVVLAWSVPIGAIAIVCGSALVVMVLQRLLRQGDRRRRNAARRLALTPAVNRISVIDYIETTARLASGTYSVDPPRVGGHLTIDAEWGDTARERVQAYLENRPTEHRDRVGFDAGTILLRGRVGLRLTNPRGCREIRPGVLPLTGRIGDHQRLSSEDGTGHRAWTISSEYAIADDPDEEVVVPVWLTPTLVPRSGRRALDLEVQWTEFGPGKHGMRMVSIDLLRVEIPSGWGHVLDTSPGDAQMITTRLPDTTRTRHIEWRNVEIDPPTSRGRHRISISLQNTITKDDVLRGTIEARFDGTLCEVDGVDLFDRTGRRRGERPTRRRHTRVRLHFTLCLDALRYEDLLILPAPPTGLDDSIDPEQPGHVVADGADSLRPTVVSYPGVVPNAGTIAALTASLGEEGNYVKRVVENPGRPGRRPSTMLRFWDIAGRVYDKLHPVDFHLIITGYEHHDGHTVVDGQTDISLTVRGAYWSDDSKAVVHHTWDTILARIDTTLRPPSRVATARPGEPPYTGRDPAPYNGRKGAGAVVPAQRWVVDADRWPTS